MCKNGDFSFDDDLSLASGHALGRESEREVGLDLILNVRPALSRDSIFSRNRSV